MRRKPELTPAPAGADSPRRVCAQAASPSDAEFYSLLSCLCTIVPSRPVARSLSPPAPIAAHHCFASRGEPDEAGASPGPTSVWGHCRKSRVKCQHISVRRSDRAPGSQTSEVLRQSAGEVGCGLARTPSLVDSGAARSVPPNKSKSEKELDTAAPS